jgi:protein-histidine pros-kinase
VSETRPKAVRCTWRPIQITDPACLVCHSTPDVAPKTMIETYGANNGFGWKLNDVIGAQVVSVPTSVPVQREVHSEGFPAFARSDFHPSMIMLNLMLYWLVIRRVKRLSSVADEVSLGNLEAGEFRSRSHDEIGVLTEALNRMKTSMVQAIKMLES